MPKFPEFTIDPAIVDAQRRVKLTDLVLAAGQPTVESHADARRWVEIGGVAISQSLGAPIDVYRVWNEYVNIVDGMIVFIGKRGFELRLPKGPPMSANARPVTTDALETLGTIISENEKRDAVHIAVEPCVAAHILRPGEHVSKYVDGTFGIGDDSVGIVDPFLRQAVKTGERFWLMLYPGKINSLRHVWTHPAFDETPPRDEPQRVAATPETAVKKAERRITEYAASIGSNFSELMHHAKQFQTSEEYWTEGGRFEGEDLPRDFWENYELVTGETVPKDKRWSFFSCSC